jgi:hypothetical protein
MDKLIKFLNNAEKNKKDNITIIKKTNFQNDYLFLKCFAIIIFQIIKITIITI